MPYTIKIGTLVLIASIPGHCLPFTFHIKVLVVVRCGGPKSSWSWPSFYFSYQCSFCGCAMWRPEKVSPHIHLILLFFQSSEGGTLVLIAPVPGHCLHFTFQAQVLGTHIQYIDGNNIISLTEKKNKAAIMFNLDF